MSTYFLTESMYSLLLNVIVNRDESFGAIIDFCNIVLVHWHGESTCSISRGSDPSFTIVNEGSEPLLIEHVDSPCQCTSTILQKSMIAPNDSSRLTITFNSKEYIDSVRKYVLIVSNDYQRRNV